MGTESPSVTFAGDPFEGHWKWGEGGAVKLVGTIDFVGSAIQGTFTTQKESPAVSGTFVAHRGL
jgi:hypothetical protein